MSTSKPRIKDRLAAAHYHPASMMPAWLRLLLPFESFYALGVAARLAAYDWGLIKPITATVPVISVGNLTTGGTGKTPIVIALAKGLVRAGKKVVVLSRGYGASHPVPCTRAGDPRHGDEACLIQEQVPEAVVMVGRDRIHVLNEALQQHRPDYILLDDGFQYLRLHRDMNILLCDGEALVGNGHLLPVGPLRESLAQIRRADVVFVTRKVSPDALQTVENWIRRYHPNPNIPVLPVPFQGAGLRPVQSSQPVAADVFAHRSVVAFSGIARPDAFERDLREAGLRVVAHQRFSDHHIYTQADVSALLALADRAADEAPLFVTTEKDWPKIREFFPADQLGSLYTLQVLPALDGRWFYEEFLTQMPVAGSRRSRQAGSPHRA